MWVVQLNRVHYAFREPRMPPDIGRHRLASGVEGRKVGGVIGHNDYTKLARAVTTIQFSA